MSEYVTGFGQDGDGGGTHEGGAHQGPRGLSRGELEGGCHGTVQRDRHEGSDFVEHLQDGEDDGHAETGFAPVNLFSRWGGLHSSGGGLGGCLNHVSSLVIGGIVDTLVGKV